MRIRLSAPFAVAITRATSLVLIPMEGQPHLNLDPASNVGKINGLLPGRYRVPILRGDGATYVASVILGGVDVLGQEIELADGSGPFEIVMKHDTGSLRGTVENGEGANVLLIRRELGDMVHYRRRNHPLHRPFFVPSDLPRSLANRPAQPPETRTCHPRATPPEPPPAPAPAQS